MPIALSGGKWLPLGELARIRDGVKESQSFAYFNDEPTVGFSLWRSKGASDTQVEDRVIRRLADLQQANPDIKIQQVFSTVDYTRASFNTAMQTLIEGRYLLYWSYFCSYAIGALL